MGEAAPQAAGGMNGEDTGKALEVLRLLWGDSYRFGYDPERGFWAIREGRLGSLLTADAPEELARLLEVAGGTGW
jgi:hypothetical protein